MKPLAAVAGAGLRRVDYGGLALTGVVSFPE